MIRGAQSVAIALVDNRRSYTKVLITIGAMLALLLAHGHSVSAAAGACTAPTTDYGNVTGLSMSNTTGSTQVYRIWTRMAAADTTNNTYLLEIDGNSCYTIGGSTVPTYASGATTYFNNNTTNWISKTNTGTQMDISLAAGTHTFKLIGNAPNVVIDRIVMTQDTTCLPTGTGDNCANPPDTTAPVVNITSPTNGASVASPVAVSVNATDDSGTVSKVELYVDGSSTATYTDSASPFNFSATGLAPGTHTFIAKAYDPSLNVTSSATVSVAVTDTTNPTVSITAPTNTSTQSGTIAVNATATDNVGVTRVELYADGQLKGTDTVSPYSFSLDTTTLTNASHALVAKAYDAAGNLQSSTTINITVNNVSGGGDTTAPSVTISAPPAGTTVIAGKPYDITATVTDASGIKQVVFKVDGVTKATVTTAPFAYSLDTTTLSDGSHTVAIQATDNSSNQNVSTLVTTTVKTTPLADVTRDCKINGGDIALILPKLGQIGTSLGNVDVNGDSKINGGDIALILPKLGQIPC